MVDTRATHNFIDTVEAKWLKLPIGKSYNQMKLVYSVAKLVEGKSELVSIESGTWKGVINLVLAMMDDFKVVIGMEFMRENIVVPIPFMNTMGILGEDLCFLPSTSYHPENKEKALSIVQLKKGLC